MEAEILEQEESESESSSYEVEEEGDDDDTNHSQKIVKDDEDDEHVVMVMNYDQVGEVRVESVTGDESLYEADDETATLQILADNGEEIDEISDAMNETDEVPEINYFKCDLCLQKFKNQFTFFEHLRTHYDSSSGPNTKKLTKSPFPVEEVSRTIREPSQSPSPHILRRRLKMLKKQRKKSAQVVCLLPEEEEVLADPIPENTNDMINQDQTQRVTRFFRKSIDYYESEEGEEDAETNHIIVNNTVKIPYEPEGMAEEEDLNEEEVVEENKSCTDDNDRKRSRVNGSPRKKWMDIVCPDCGEAFESSSKLRAHKKLAHDESIRKKPERLSVSERLRLRVSALKCKQCSKVFNHKNSFMYHMKGHKNERNHECNVCGKKFLTSSALNVHNRLHTGEKPYQCQHCSRLFRQWGDLTYHVISLHSTVRAYVCEFCGKDFARKYSLTVHRRIHTLECNYTCDFCSKSFRAASYLQSHRRIHTGEKPHTCDICGKPFRVKSDMNRHRHSHNHHERKPRARRQRTASTAAPLLTTVLRRKDTSSIHHLTHNTVKAEETIVVQNLVTVDESGQIIELEKEIAEQFRVGQVIQVPLVQTSPRQTSRRITRIESEDGSSLITSGHIHTNSISNDVLKKEEADEVSEYIQDAVISGDVTGPIQGSLYVWPNLAFM